MAFGYNAEGDYLIKNSWGTRWGYQGFATISQRNDCGMRQYVVQLTDGTTTNQLSENSQCKQFFSNMPRGPGYTNFGERWTFMLGIVFTLMLFIF